MRYSYTHILAIGISILLLTGCDNFLDIQPTGKVIPKTLSEYRALLTTAYSNNLYDKGVTEVRTDIAQTLRSNNITTPQNTFGDIEIWNDLSPSSSTRQFEWLRYYENIYIANNIIINQKEITQGTTDDINQLVGEAYLMRAYMHFILANLYAQPYTKTDAPNSRAIPLKLDIDLEGTPSKNTLEEVYQSIISDINSAINSMTVEQWTSPEYSYRFAKNSAYAFASRVYLYMGRWQESLDFSQNTLQINSQLQNLTTQSDTLPSHYLSAERITSYEIILNSDYAASFIVDSLFYSRYTEHDGRKQSYFSVQNNLITSNKAGVLAHKCSFRVGELYLNAAESAVHLRLLSEARTFLLTLLKQRYHSSEYTQRELSVNSASAEQLLEEILEQRALELAFEGHRWFDLRRTYRPQLQKVINGNTYLLAQDDSRYTLRIPQEAIDNNPSLLQP